MLKLRDFYHLPQVDTFIEQMVADGPGLLLVAGLDSRPAAAGKTAASLSSSGRSTLLRLLVDQSLEGRPQSRCMVISEEKSFYKPPRAFRERVSYLPVNPPYTYGGRVIHALASRPELVVIDRLTPDNTAAALDAARQGLKVISQVDTVFKGSGVARHLMDMGAAYEQLDGLAWVLAVQRMPTLCPKCKQPTELNPAYLERLDRHAAGLDALLDIAPAELAGGLSQDVFKENMGGYFRAGSCEACGGTGRKGEMTIFDVFRADRSTGDLLGQPSTLPMDLYALQLASLGHLALDDCLGFEANQLHRTFSLLLTREQALREASSAYERKLAELEAANRVLQQRTKSLISLQDINQSLTTLVNLDELAARVCRHARDLCGADRAALYYLRTPEEAEVLAVVGWEAKSVHTRLPAGQVFGAGARVDPAPYPHQPPGIPPLPVGRTPVSLRAGLYVPLVTQDQRVGAMIVHTTQKPFFSQGEVALLQTFANQAALAVQRAGLIDELQAKIEALEAAQAGLAKKERMERELELARQVQQSVLPLTFPEAPGYGFAARNEPARQVGGDFYDVIWLDDDHFAVAIADVSDKGLPAALYMALTRSLLLAEARRELSPARTIASVNQLLLELAEPNMFVTVFYGVIERSTRRMRYIRAGHDWPLVLREGQAWFLEGAGRPLGLFTGEEFPLTEEETSLQPGDRLALYTDGLTDLLGPGGDTYGRERLKALLQANGRQTAGAVCEAVFSDLAAFQGSAEQYDDMTLLIVEVD